MYKTSVRALMRYAINQLNQGDASMMLRFAAPDAFIAFPGDNSWATMFRPANKGRNQHPTHRGLDECGAFADRFTDQGIQFDIEDILVNGPPWNTRVALRVVSYKAGSGESGAEGNAGVDDYNNRAIALLELRWGRLVAWEDYEDTERVAEWDRNRELTAV
jgi:hypothetical protein